MARPTGGNCGVVLRRCRWRPPQTPQRNTVRSGRIALVATALHNVIMRCPPLLAQLPTGDNTNLTAVHWHTYNLELTRKGLPTEAILCFTTIPALACAHSCTIAMHNFPIMRLVFAISLLAAVSIVRFSVMVTDAVCRCGR